VESGHLGLEAWFFWNVLQNTIFRRSCLSERFRVSFLLFVGGFGLDFDGSSCPYDKPGKDPRLRQHGQVLVIWLQVK
jgi:hypothetical protein